MLYKVIEREAVHLHVTGALINTAVSIGIVLHNLVIEGLLNEKLYDEIVQTYSDEGAGRVSQTERQRTRSDGR